MVKEHICNYEGCGRTFASNKNLKDHIRTHTGEKPFVCERCNKRFGQYSTLHKHYRVHDKKRPYKCDIEGCEKSFTQVSNLIRHQRVHTGDKPYECDKCDKKFSSSSNLKQHLTIHKKNDERSKFQCDICQKNYLYPSSLRKHKETDHPEFKANQKSKQSQSIENIEEIKVKTEPQVSEGDSIIKLIEQIDKKSQNKRAIKIESQSNSDDQEKKSAYEEAQKVAYYNLRKTLKDNGSIHSKDNLNYSTNAQEQFSFKSSMIGYQPIERKSALTRFSDNMNRSPFIMRQPNDSFGIKSNTTEVKMFPFCGSVSGKSFNINAEQDSQTSSMINGFTGRDFSRIVPPINQNFECESRGGYGLLPEGIGAISDQSKLKKKT